MVEIYQFIEICCITRENRRWVSIFAGSRRKDFNRIPKPIASPNRVRLSTESLIQKLENGNSSCLRSWFATLDFYALHYALFR